MNQFLKNTVVLLLFIMIGGRAMAQKFTTHAVKEGETLESIAKLYRVTPYNILSYNKELKQGQDLTPNTILVIPTDVKTSEPSVDVPKKSNKLFDEDVKEQEPEEPIGFTSHKVRKRETLYGIAKRYHITEDDIKRYNTALYASQLRKKMVLRIPKYKRVKPEDAIAADEGNFEIYTVAAKETRWSIAHKYGITIDSMVALNSGLSKTSNYLAEGQQLRLPKIAGSSVEDIETQLYISYTVPPKMGFYRLEKEYGVTAAELMKLNPEIGERGGLKEGMVIRIPEKKLDTGDINTENFIFYEVKPKQNEFRLTRKFGMTYKELLEYNPELNNGLKAGMVLKLPKDLVGNFEVRNSLVLDKINLLDSINVVNRPKLLFLLPFRLDKMNVANREGTKKMIQNRTDVKLSLGIYSGALIAIDSIASLGISVDVKTFDNQLDLDKTKEILLQENLSDVNAIIGPLDVPSLREVAVRAAAYEVPVLAPIPAATDISLSNVFFTYTPDGVLRKKILDHVTDKRVDQSIIIIADSTNVTVRDSILSKFPEAKVVKVIEEEKNVGINRDKLAELLSEEVENWVFVETNNFKLISSVVSILNSFHNTLMDPLLSKEKVRVRMFTTNKNKAFDNDVIPGSHLSNLNFTYPSVYRQVDNNAFVKRYRKRFGNTPDRYAVRGFDIAYDLLLKLAYKNNLIEVSKLIGETTYTGNKFSYEKDIASGYYNQAAYIMSYENMRIKEVKE